MSYKQYVTNILQRYYNLITINKTIDKKLKKMDTINRKLLMKNFRRLF